MDKTVHKIGTKMKYGLTIAKIVKKLLILVNYWDESNSHTKPYFYSYCTALKRKGGSLLQIYFIFYFSSKKKG